MSVSERSKWLLTGAAVISVVAVTGWRIEAQGGGQVQRNPCAECGTPVNDAPNPYRTIENFFKLPDGRSWGSTSLVDIDRNGKDIWAVDRCGANSCVSDPATGALNPEDVVFKFAGATGAVLAHFGGGMIVMPHGIFVDKDDNVWVTDNADNAPRAARGAAPAGAPPAGAPPAGAAPAAGRGPAAPPTPGAGATKGHQVFKFTPTGKVLMTLGKPGGSLTECCFQPNDVIVGPDGSIYVSQGHNDAGGPQVIWKFTKDGKPLTSFGKFGHERGEFDQPHALAFDSKGRLFVGDRNNNRIQIFDQNGKLLDVWYQFSRPSGLFIDKKDMLYSADSESVAVSRNHFGWKNGIRIGSVKDGKVIAFIPDPATNPTNTSAAEGVAADDAGNIYGAEVGPRALKKYVKQ
jgi:outer membrane protein assembly factor BamB